MIQEVKDIYIKQYRLFEQSLNGVRHDSIHQIRRKAIEQFEKLGFPTTKHEEWRFTNISPLTRIQFTPAYQVEAQEISEEQFNKISIKRLNGIKLIFINGKYSEKLSDKSFPKGIEISSLAHILQNENTSLHKIIEHFANIENNSFTSLNTSFLLEGVFIQIHANIEINEPIYLVYITTDTKTPLIIHPRNIIMVAKNSKASIIEHYISTENNSNFTNAVSEIRLDENAVLEHNKIQTESNNAFHIGSTYIEQLSKSKFTSNSIMIGGSLVRNNIYATLNGEETECTLNGLSLASGNQLIDNHTSIDHAKPNCSSREFYKAILDGKARGVFNGKIYVRKDSQKTDSKQTNKTLLLSDEATMNTKPQLEIFADDVKCTHGAAIGYLDSDSLFYLRSRGISENIARDILTYAFANDIIERITIEPIQEYLHNILFSRFKKARILTNE